MFTNKLHRLSSLLLALGMLLGLAVTGCSDSDRDKGQDVKSLKEFSYVYTLTTPTKAQSTAQFITVCAYDADGVVIENGAKLLAEDGSRLDTQETADQYDEESNKYYADTLITSDVDSVMYAFYHEETSESGETFKISDGYELVTNVATIADGQEVKDGDTQVTPVTISIKCYNSNNEESYEYNTGDTVIIKTFAGGEELTDYDAFTIYYDSDYFSEVEGANDMRLIAKAAGTTDFAVEIDGIITDSLGKVTIKDATNAELTANPEAVERTGANVKAVSSFSVM